MAEPLVRQRTRPVHIARARARLDLHGVRRVLQAVVVLVHLARLDLSDLRPARTMRRTRHDAHDATCTMQSVCARASQTAGGIGPGSLYLSDLRQVSMTACVCALRVGAGGWGEPRRASWRIEIIASQKRSSSAL